MARLLSTSPAITAPKTANVYIPIETPQKQVPTSSYLRQTAPRDLGEDVLPGGSLRVLDDGTLEVVEPGQQGLGGPPEGP